MSSCAGMWSVPKERRAWVFHAWLARGLAPGERLELFTHGRRTLTPTVAKALGALASLGRSLADEVRARGVLRSLAEVAAVSAVDAAFGGPDTTFADVVWRDPRAGGFGAPEVGGLAVGLAPTRLLLLTLLAARHDTTLEEVWAPGALASLDPAAARAANLRVRTVRIVRSENVTLSIGRGAAEESFVLGEDPVTLEHARALEARLAGAAGR